MMNCENEPRSSQLLYFDSDKHPETTLKAFNEFCDTFVLRYNALYPDPPKVSIDAALTRWKFENTTRDIDDPKPTLAQYDEIRNAWRSKDKVTKFLGLFSSKRFHTDWCAAQQNETQRENASWAQFLEWIRVYYKPTENPTLKNFHFRDLNQQPDETFTAFCNRVQKEASHCYFKCENNDCTAEATATRDQIVIGTHYQNIREKALLKSWDLQTLRTEGMKMESALKGGSEIGGENVNKLGKYSFKNLKQQQYVSPSNSKAKYRKPLTCYNCGEKTTNITQHRERNCKGTDNKCSKCSKDGHLPSVCRSKNHDVKNVYTEDDNSDSKHESEHEDRQPAYNVNLFVINSSKNAPKPKLLSTSSSRNEFSVQVVVNNALDKVLADTGAKVIVCGTVQARKWGILNKMVESKVRIQPYKSDPIPVYGTARCAVSFGTTIIPVDWHIISGSCEPILSGTASRQLSIIRFNATPDTYEPIHMIAEHADPESKQDLQDILLEYPETFTGLGKLKNHEVRLHVDKSVKPVVTPPRTTPYHLQDRVQELIDEMIANDVIEELPVNEAAQWISCSTIAPKTNGDIRMTLNARNINKALQSSNLPIPRQEDIKAKLSGANIFSKLDFKNAFWQLELHPDSRYLTIFYCNGRLYRYKRLTMGLKPAQGELNAALAPIFSHIKNVHLIHDDLIIATATKKEHRVALKAVLKAISDAGLTLNPEKCLIGSKEIHFWGLLITSEGIRPDPAKVSALDYVTPPTNKQEVTSFLCMMQANAEFIPNFAQKSDVLRELTRGDKRFVWKNKHASCFETLLQEFREATLLRYFDPQKRTFVIVDAHITGLGATLAQGNDIETMRPVGFASRTTKPQETRYPQLDLEATSVDFGLTRFRNYLVGSPETIIVVTDHKPLCSIFNGKRRGSIRTERMKLLHQDIPFQVEYRPGKDNQADYLSRNATPISQLSIEEQGEPDYLTNLLYTLHTTPIMDHIGLAMIAEHTTNDHTLRKLRDIVTKGQTWIPKDADSKLRKFQKILPTITVTGNGILLKDERIILPESLHLQAIELAHRGSHPGETGIQRRLRYHFFFHNLNDKVHTYIITCKDCQSFTDKKTCEPLTPHAVPDKNWSKVSVDLFGPMPSKNHVVVVQDMLSRFPAGKIVTSTKATTVIPALADIYNNFGNPETQLSDNGAPFNSTAMDEFCKSRNIKTEKIPPLHPSANPVETFMKTIGKSMKIGKHNKVNEKRTLTQLLSNYRGTPHPATGMSPSDMFFQHSPQSVFPRKDVNEQDVQNARQRDELLKRERKNKINAGKYRKISKFQVGDIVLVRNFNKSSKYDPYFQYDPLEIIQVNNNGRCLTLRRLNDGKSYQRHPDDVKLYRGPIDDVSMGNKGFYG